MLSKPLWIDGRKCFLLTKWVVWGFTDISQAVAGALMCRNETCFLRRDRLRAIVGQNGLPHGFWHKTHKCAFSCIEGAAALR
jgi:hypothetical protein